MPDTAQTTAQHLSLRERARQYKGDRDRQWAEELRAEAVRRSRQLREDAVRMARTALEVETTMDDWRPDTTPDRWDQRTLQTEIDGLGLRFRAADGDDWDKLFLAVPCPECGGSRTALLSSGRQWSLYRLAQLLEIVEQGSAAVLRHMDCETCHEAEVQQRLAERGQEAEPPARVLQPHEAELLDALAAVVPALATFIRHTRSEDTD